MKPDPTTQTGVHNDATLQPREGGTQTDANPVHPVSAGSDHRGTSSELMPELGETVLTSPRKVEANRRNAQRSTGPRTALGKSRVSRNAVKHGIFSKNLLTRDADGCEDPREYCQMHAAISEHYQPQGLLEELVVDRIASVTWRLARVPRCERGQIDRALNAHRFQAGQGRGHVADSAELLELHNPADDKIFDDLLLPSNGELDRLLRYEDAISKQRDRAIAELETLQVRRRASSEAKGDSEKQSH
jgi:hypothetical protein